MRERLIELLKAFRTPICEGLNAKLPDVDAIADYLLAEGVIVPPCKVGDTVYSINRKPLSGHWEDNKYFVDNWGEFKVCEIPFSLTLWECGWKGIFLTKEEAEQALAERRIDNGTAKHNQ